MKPTTSPAVITSRIIKMLINFIRSQVNESEFECVRSYCIGNSDDVALSRSQLFPCRYKSN
jgi:hypothetical protein